MSWLQKLLGKKEGGHRPPAPGAERKNPFAGLEGIRFGRYSDNNKSYARDQKWYTAEEQFRTGNPAAGFAAFFEYIRDEQEDNVRFVPQGAAFRFELLQGSRRIKGSCDGQRITAKALLAHMDKPGTALMRRLLDLNYTLHYSRCALDNEDVLCMLFDTDVASVNTSKLYFGLRELATRADRQDEQLMADFAGRLSPSDGGDVSPLPENERTVKYTYFLRWIREALDRADRLNQDAFSGAISYLLLTTLYRIDFLMQPEGQLLADLERVHGLYWDKKDEIPLVERNQMMKDAMRKLLELSPESFSESVYRSRFTFAIASPPKADMIRDHILNANRDSRWYIDNRYPELALVLSEYGMLYNCYISSMPRVLSDLTVIYMAALHPGFFSDLGMKEPFYTDNRFNRDAIAQAAETAVDRYLDRYPQLYWEHSRISYHSLYDFAVTFSEQVANLNLETKR